MKKNETTITFSDVRLVCPTLPFRTEEESIENYVSTILAMGLRIMLWTEYDAEMQKTFNYAHVGDANRAFVDRDEDCVIAIRKSLFKYKANVGNPFVPVN